MSIAIGGAALILGALGMRRIASAVESYQNDLRGGRRIDRALLDEARKDLGVKEESKNDGAAIRGYFEGTGITPPANWCAAAVSSWSKRAASRLGLVNPLQPTARAKAIKEQLEKLSHWYSADWLRSRHDRLIPGMIVVWDRSDPKDPKTAWQGHIGVVSVAAIEGGAFRSIEGNSGPTYDAVAEIDRNINDPRFLGAGWL